MVHGPDNEAGQEAITTRAAFERSTGRAAIAAELTAKIRMVKSRLARMGRVGRNAPCPCGSGLKHKRCCPRELYELQRLRDRLEAEG